MTTQSGVILDDNFLKRLGRLGYEKVNLKGEANLVSNVKNQLEKTQEFKKGFLQQKFV